MSTSQRLATSIHQPINTLHFYLLSRIFHRPIIRLLKRPHGKEHVYAGGIAIGPRNSAVECMKVIGSYAWWHCTSLGPLPYLAVVVLYRNRARRRKRVW